MPNFILFLICYIYYSPPLWNVLGMIILKALCIRIVVMSILDHVLRDVFGQILRHLRLEEQICCGFILLNFIVDYYLIRISNKHPFLNTTNDFLKFYHRSRNDTNCAT